ncbi:dynactin subunit [Trichoderma arundinaceum]|uniref:Dynactin subunit 4 n=1 Tax=Trichoderma arundinaceum TaxID=490622 RepID=A0A395NG94_TRIAR|nr:dynactin subunit [Trichoderma arundinaceum]
MSLSTPYTYIQCPCSDQTVFNPGGAASEPEEYERTFDPKAPRSNYSLYPLEYLLYCEDCQQIRCPRCVTEESVTYYCPNCLFEVPSSNLRSEGNRCTRSCYQCPVCIGPLQVGAIQPTTDANLLPTQYQSNPNGGPYALFCQYCNWTSTEIGIEFERPSGIYNQLSKVNNGGQPKLTLRDVKDRRKDNPDEPPVPDDQLDADLQFANLKAFYQTQISETNTSIRGLPLHDGIGFSSPAALTRIMSLYTGRGHQGRLQQGPADIMREALGTNDGLKIANLDESKDIKKLISGGWDVTASIEQRSQQSEPTRFEDELRPIPYLLRSKRSKRCPACRHIISKPEAKVTSTRFKIRLVAKSYIPTITIRPLNPTAAPVPITYRPMVQEEAPLKPHQPYHFVVTFKNPLFDNIKVTLASPNATPGRFSSRVTVLCPQFEVDANTDMWDDALKDDERDKSRKADEGPEVGKIWEKGRNWVSIVLEVIPASLRIDQQQKKGGEKVDTSPLKEGEDILEIPMFVRMEWESDTQADMDGPPSKDKETREKRELAYWCVLGVGRISHE